MNKEKFLHLALKIFKSSGYSLPPLKVLLQQSGWSRGDFCSTFDSKKKFDEVLLEYAARRVLSPIIKAVESKENASDRLQIFIEKSLSLNPPVTLEPLIWDIQNKLLQDILYQGQKEKVFIKSIDKEVQTHLIMNALLGNAPSSKKIGLSRRSTGLLSLVLMGIERK